jgi:N-methylhydantoinase A
VGEGHTVRAKLTKRSDSAAGAAPISGTRAIDVGGDAGWVDVDVVLGEDLHPGHQLTGPAVVDSVDTTIWMPPGARAVVDRFGTIDMEVPA